VLSLLPAQTVEKHMVINQDCKEDGEEHPTSAAYSKSLYPHVVDHCCGDNKYVCSEVVVTFL
jgi:hypothetical protein